MGHVRNVEIVWKLVQLLLGKRCRKLINSAWALPKVLLSYDMPHTIYTRNNMGQKCEGNCGLWVLNEIRDHSITTWTR